MRNTIIGLCWALSPTVIGIAAFGVLVWGFSYAAPASPDCGQYLTVANRWYQQSQESLTVLQQTESITDGIYNLQRYQICKQYGE